MWENLLIAGSSVSLSVNWGSLVPSGKFHAFMWKGKSLKLLTIKAETFWDYKGYRGLKSLDSSIIPLKLWHFFGECMEVHKHSSRKRDIFSLELQREIRSLRPSLGECHWLRQYMALSFPIPLVAEQISSSLPMVLNLSHKGFWSFPFIFMSCVFVIFHD